MYKKYRLSITEDEVQELLSFSVRHTPIVKKNIDAEVEKVLRTDNANWIMDTWFPQYNADIFLSHSHDDYNLAKKLAAQFESFGLKVFIDSEVWGYANELLRKVDNECCVKKKELDGSNIYSYEKRNQTTAQINIMLAHALIRMIDLTECFVFLETSKSTTKVDKSNIETMSPWLFHELNVVQVIEQRQKVRNRNFAEDSAMEKLSESVTGFKFTASAQNMSAFSYTKLKDLFDKARNMRNALSGSNCNGVKFLDLLYENFA